MCAGVQGGCVMCGNIQRDVVHPPKALQSVLSSHWLGAQIYVLICIFHEPI